MKGQDEPLFSVVSDAQEKLLAELRPLFASYGNPSVRCLTPAMLAHTVLSPADILIIDFNTSTLDEYDLKGHTLLGLLPAEEIESASDRVSACTEVAVWPGDLDEIKAKLQRLRRLVAMQNRITQRLTLKLSLVGESDAFSRVLADIGKYSKCDAPVLIMGETGTGKEQIARAIHYLGVAEGKPFVAVNCGALPDSLVENELFGHVKGAYTDAKVAQCGLVEQADGGTLFLDEIEALSPKGQVVLLRFLQDFEYRPLGAQRSKKAQLRLITASNEPLPQLVADGLFRKDLFYRLNILALELPPLRQRAGDISLLAEHFIDKYRDLYQQYDKYLDPGTHAWMARYEWPGNVRELENLILREFLLADTACISIAPIEGTQGERRKHGFDRRFGHLYRHNFQDAKSAIVNEFERCYLQQVLREANGNISAAARQAGKERRTFAKLLEKHGIDKKQTLTRQN